MEIHSSSLRLPASISNLPRVDKPTTVDGNVKDDEVKLLQKQNKKSQQSALPTQTPAEIEQALTAENLQLTPISAIDDGVAKSFNRRTQQALNAYTEQLNQPIVNQRRELVSRIDFHA